MKEILEKLFENNVSMTVRPELDVGYLTFDLRKCDYCTRFGLNHEEIYNSKVDKKWLLERKIDDFLFEYKRRAEPVNVKEYYVCFTTANDEHTLFKYFAKNIVPDHLYIVNSCDMFRRVIELKDGSRFRFVNVNDPTKLHGFRDGHISYTEFVNMFFDKIKEFKENDHKIIADKRECLSCEHLIFTPVHQEPCKSCGKYK